MTLITYTENVKYHLRCSCEFVNSMSIKQVIHRKWRQGVTAPTTSAQKGKQNEIA